MDSEVDKTRSSQSTSERKECTTAFLRRIVHKIAPDKWDEVVEWEAKYDAIESRYGAPPKRLYRAEIGPYDRDTLFVEAEWECYSAAEEIMSKFVADSDWQKVHADAASVFLTSRYETYSVLK